VTAFETHCAEFIRHSPTPNTVCALLCSPQRAPEFALCFLEDHCSQCLSAPFFLQLSAQRVLQLLHSAHTAAAEDELFDGLVRWLHHQQQKVPADFIGQALRAVRFRHMPVSALSGAVSRSGLLSTEQVVAVVAACAPTVPNAPAPLKPAAPSANALEWTGAAPSPSPPQSMSKSDGCGVVVVAVVGADLSLAARRPRSLHSAWRWSASEQHPTSIALSGDGLSAAAQHSPYTFCRVYGDSSWHQALAPNPQLVPDHHRLVRWEVTLKALDQTKGAKVMIGVVPAHDDQWAGPTTHSPPPAFCAACACNSPSLFSLARSQRKRWPECWAQPTVGCCRAAKALSPLAPKAQYLVCHHSLPSGSLLLAADGCLVVGGGCSLQPFGGRRSHRRTPGRGRRHTSFLPSKNPSSAHISHPSLGRAPMRAVGLTLFLMGLRQNTKLLGLAFSDIQVAVKPALVFHGTQATRTTLPLAKPTGPAAPAGRGVPAAPADPLAYLLSL
jgi:hypothetical protein